MTVHRFAALLLAAACLVSPALAQAGTPDLILLHGRIWTENPAQPEAQAIAIEGERIVAVGPDAQIAALAGRKTRTIDLAGRRVVPGFNDSHVHLVEGGLGLIGVHLTDAASAAEFRDRIGAYTKKLAPGEWIGAGNWDHQRWPGAALPTHQLIDAVTPANPVFVWRMDGHMALANALAMKLAGIDRNTPDPVGGRIERDAGGNPTGIFKDAATALISAKIPPLSPAMYDRILAADLAEAASHGVTSVQDMSAGESDAESAGRLRAWARAAQAGRLTMRIYASRGFEQAEQPLPEGIPAGGAPGLRLGVTKTFADGAIGSMTAWMYQPFVGTTNAGIASAAFADIPAVYARWRRLDAAGGQLATHAIGDKAIATVLDLYAKLASDNGARDRRPRIEHVQHLAAADIPRFARLGVVASMQPYHAVDDGRWAGAVLGPERAARSYAWRSLLDAGARLAFGSDWPVAPLDPVGGIAAAVTRATIDGKQPGGWVPEQRITVAQAVHAYTVGSAYAEFQDKVKGSLEPGKLADLVALSADIFTIAPTKIADTRVDLTIVGGKVIYQRKP